jgi:hypothetical protein
MLTSKNERVGVGGFSFGRGGMGAAPFVSRVLITLVLTVAIGSPASATSRYANSWPLTDFDKTLIDLDEIISGGPPKDGIPAIDRPRFVSIDDARSWLDPTEPVVVVRIAEHARAYPLQILMYHEIVNDTLSEVPISVTFCPLCNAAIAFDRRVKDDVLDFGTTGLLRKSDLVMYDRQTESWWQQFTGTAIVGALMGTKLQTLPAPIAAFGDFTESFPGGEVLSRDTGYRRSYGSNPYRGYDSITDRPFLYRDPVDPRLPPMERVLNISINDVHRIYPMTELKVNPVINDRVGDLPVAVFSREGVRSALDRADIADSKQILALAAYHRVADDGTLLHFEIRNGEILDRETGSTWTLFGAATDGPLAGTQLEAVDGGVHFAFAWLAFNPGSEIYRAQ